MFAKRSAAICGEIVAVFVQGPAVILPGQLARVTTSSYHVADESLAFPTFHIHRSRPNGSIRIPTTRIQCSWMYRLLLLLLPLLRHEAPAALGVTSDLT
jgi:hypothetical protein